MRSSGSALANESFGEQEKRSKMGTTYLKYLSTYTYDVGSGHVPTAPGLDIYVGHVSGFDLDIVPDVVRMRSEEESTAPTVLALAY